MEPPIIEDCRVNEAVDPDSPIGQTARAWALAVVGEDFPPERSRLLGAWLDADPLHRRAYEQAEGVVLMLGALGAAPAVERARSPAARPAPRWRVPAMAAGGLLAACLAIAVFALPAPAFETQPGETRQIALSDGSQVTLAPASRLKAASRWRPRALSLERGEAFFVVTHQDGQPFTVQAGDATVRVIGTRFNVHHGADQDVRVEVEQGVVQVSAGGRDRAVTLRAGQTAVAGARGLTAVAQSGQAGGWRQGRLAYDDAPLAEVVADLNRYSQRPLTVDSAATGRLKVTAAFDVAQADRFVAELPRVLPVRLASDGRGGRILVAADPKRAPEPHAR
jgi:transmembrane sensor